jgi:hypothetical protein
MTVDESVAYWQDRAAAAERIFDLAMTRIRDLELELTQARDRADRLWQTIERLEGQVTRLIR